jgi:hypothetical protein
MRRTPSKSSPRGGRRGCLCGDGRTYSRKCCDGSLLAQGIGSTEKSGDWLEQESGYYLMTEDNNHILL